MTNRSPNEYCKAQSKRLLSAWYKARGETVKIRMMNSTGVRRGGSIYDIPAEKRKAGDIEIRLSHVLREGKIYITAQDVLLGGTVKSDKIVEIMEWERPVAVSGFGGHFYARRRWKIGEPIENFEFGTG